ncbi:cardioacceleratory peptide receptor-like isoform X2 [Varroa jacobsoni]|uniref:cardioacceleratory peptide receptor-like isoform X2 n=1 Tax=Varroa jacobsoni TaxID=62625 RepID=UPI000BF6B427|nr:cardioacceleratory peptide receptor-like isoform X2 [Varroa jacobsoni]
MDESLTTVASAASISGLDKTAELRRLFEHYSKLQGYDYDEVLRIMNETGFNFTDPEDDIYIFYKTETLIFLSVLFTLIVVGNCAVLATLLASKNRKSRMNFFIMHLAIADLLVGLVNVLTDILWKITVEWHAGNAMCKIVKYAQVVVTYSSTYVLVALSIDRYDAITHPMNFSGGWKRARWLVTTAWFLSFLLSTPALFINHEAVVKERKQCWIDLSADHWKLYMTLVAVSLFFIPTIIIAACYSIIVYTIWTKSKVLSYPKSSLTSSKVSKSSLSVGGVSTKSQKSCHSSGGTNSDTESKRASSRGIIPKAKIKTIKMTLIIVFVFVLCWSPYMIYDLLQVYGYAVIEDRKTATAVATFMQSLAPLNSLANPMIYCLFSTHVCRNIRNHRWFDWLAGKLCTCFLCSSSAETRRDANNTTSTITSSHRRLTTSNYASLSTSLRLLCKQQFIVTASISHL